VSITADNASNNSTLASCVEQVLDGRFKASDKLLGCMAHVINLAAKDGLGAFGSPTAMVKQYSISHVSLYVSEPQ
jgi:hypothetical protein